MRVIHLLSKPDEPREYRSIQEIRQVTELAGYEYIQMVNEPWTGEIPEARHASDRPFELTKRHFGCYAAHRDAIREYLNEDGIFIFECDGVFAVSHEEAVQRMKRAVEVCNKHPEILLFQFGYRHNGQGISFPESDVICINSFIETHAYYLPWSSKPVMDAFFEKPWDAYDYTITIYGCDQTGAQIGIFADRPVCVQGIGVSIIDGKLKGSEPHFRNVRYNASISWKA